MTAVADTAPARQERQDHRRATQSLCLVLTATFVVFADVTIVAIAAPAIQASLGASVPEIEMMIAVYQIAYAATVITGGRLGDIYGRRVMFVAGFAGFALTSTACGLARTAPELIVCRGLQGVASAMLSPQVLPTIQIVLPLARRARAYAAQGAVLALASMTGPALAGLLISANLFGLGWRPVFLINLPISLVAMVLGLRLIPVTRSPSARSLDVLGSLIAFVMLASVMAALTVGQLYRWPPWAWLCLAAGPVLSWIFLRSQRAAESRGRSPLLPMRLWRDRAFRAGLLLYVAVLSSVGTFYVYYFILLETGYRLPTWLAGLTVISVGAGTIATSLVSVRLANRFGGRQVVAAGAIVGALGFGSLLIPVNAVHAASLAEWTIPSQFVGGCGVGLLIAPLLGVVMTGVRQADVGAATGVLTASQMIGRAFGVGFTGILFVIPLPLVIASATTAELTRGMTYGLLYSPALFLLSLLVITRLPPPSAPADDQDPPGEVSAPPGEAAAQKAAADA